MAVTGALGFSARQIATRLLAAGHDVLNLTNHPDRPDPFGGRLSLAPLAFDVDALAASLDGVDTLFNTYWVRFAHGATDHALAVRNSQVLFEAAALAGTRPIVHTSIANADPASADSYYRGKAQVEAALAAAGPSYAVLRPAVLFGDEPILVNSIAWLLRHMPVFMIPGNGSYGIQPTHVEDLADVAVRLATGEEACVTDVAGRERFTFNEFVRLIRDAVGSRTLLLHAPPTIALLAAQVLAPIVRDVLITRQEIAGLTAGLLVSREPPLGERRFTEWLADASPWLGRSYLSEVGRHFAS
jgi:nucleoside-diphosphate-sugar epimerase